MSDKEVKHEVIPFIQSYYIARHAPTLVLYKKALDTFAV